MGSGDAQATFGHAVHVPYGAGWHPELNPQTLNHACVCGLAAEDCAAHVAPASRLALFS